MRSGREGVCWAGKAKLNSQPRDLMSALGHKQTFPEVCAMSAIPPKADIG
jgi:hypothetical protein